MSPYVTCSLFSGLTIWHWRASWRDLPRKSHLSWLYSVDCGSLCRAEAPWAFLNTIWHVHCLLLVQLMFGWSCGWDFITRRQNVTAQSPSLWLLQFVCSLFHSLPWASEFCSCIHCIHQDWLHNSAYLLVVVLCSGLHPLQRKVSLMKAKTTLLCGYKDKCLFILRDHVGLVNYWL